MAERRAFLAEVLRRGLGPVGNVLGFAGVSVLTIIALFVVRPLLGLAALLALALALLFEGSFRSWRELKDAIQPTEPESLSEALDDLISTGEGVQRRVDTDATWTMPARQAAVAEWGDEVRKTLRNDRQGARYLAFFEWQDPAAGEAPPMMPMIESKSVILWRCSHHIARLREIKERVVVRETGQHPDGPERVRLYRFKDELLSAQAVRPQGFGLPPHREAILRWADLVTEMIKSSMYEEGQEFMFRTIFDPQNMGESGGMSAEENARVASLDHQILMAQGEGQQFAVKPDFEPSRWAARWSTVEVV